MAKKQTRAAVNHPAKSGARAAPARAPRRTDLGSDISIYFDALAPEQKAIALELRWLIESAAPKASASIKWGMPVYEHHGMLCYIRARPRYVTLGFYESGTSLDDPDGLLEGSGDNMRHIKVPGLDAVKAAYFKRLVKGAVRFNERGT